VFPFSPGSSHTVRMTAAVEKKGGRGLVAWVPRVVERRATTLLALSCSIAPSVQKPILADTPDKMTETVA